MIESPVKAVPDKKAGGVLQKLRNSCHKEPKAESPVEAVPDKRAGGDKGRSRSKNRSKSRSQRPF